MYRELDFFSTLRKRIEVKPNRDFDREFWRAFDSEFSRKNVGSKILLLKLTFAPAFTVLPLQRVFLSIDSKTACTRVRNSMRKMISKKLKSLSKTKIFFKISIFT